MKRIALIGHRGVGKSELLKRIAVYHGSSAVNCMDLDNEIEVRTSRSICDIFKSARR